MNQTTDLLRDVNLIIKTCERKATEDNMIEQQKKDYINEILMRYLEKTTRNARFHNYDNMERILPIYEEAYSDFSREEFVRYVLTHTSNADIIFEEKLKIEKRLNEIYERIACIDGSLRSEENLRKSSPEIFENIDTAIGSEIYFALNKQRLEEEKRALQELEKGLLDICKKFDTRLPISLKGTKEQRNEFEHIGDEKRYNDIIETLTEIKNTTADGENIDEKVFEYYKTFIGIDTCYWTAFWSKHTGVAEDIYNIFVRCVPSFEKYLKNRINDLRTEIDQINRKTGQLYRINREIKKRVIAVKKSPIKIEYYYVEDEFYITPQRKKRKIEGEQIPSPNLADIEQKLEQMLNDESKEDPIKLNEELMQLYLKQVKRDDEGRYILQDMHDLFVSKYQPFKEYLQGWSNIANKLTTEIDELEQTKNDLSEQIHSFNVHYQSHPDGYSTEDHEKF